MTSLVYQKTEAAVMEVVIYKIKKGSADNFEEVLSAARSTIEDFPGFIEYKTLRSKSSDMLFIDLVKWGSLESAKAAAKKVEEMKEMEAFMAAFEEILIMDHFELFTDEVSNHKTELRIDPGYYKATLEPKIIELGPINYLSIKGISSPEDTKFLGAVEAIYAVANNLRFASNSTGSGFEIANMEALWWVEANLPFDQTPQEDWHWNILIKLPDFIDPEQVDAAVEQAIHKNRIILANEVEFTTINEGKSVQILHIGSYEEEKPTIDKVMEFLKANNLQINGHHHEIYISDPAKTAKENLKTVIRYPVK